jgi:hypothetical protein
VSLKTGFSSRLLSTTEGTTIDAIRKSVAAASGNFVKVGVPSGKNEKDGTPIAMIAAVHEFGSVTRGIPERSFLRAGIRENQADFVRLNRVNLAKVAAGRMHVRDALGQLGAMAAGKVQTKITDGPFEPLKAATINRKGSSKPLINTGNMRQAITWKVDEK